MFIDTLPKRTASLQRSENVIFGDKLFRSLRSFGDRLDVPGKVSIESRA